ncbi:Ankyrin repeat-containing domain [Phytophthora cactorum]|nr:Ankyrin repeat-containing domain [Phytophthora cactorum]
MLLFAARDGDVKKARFLLENNASVDIRTGYGATALHFAASWGQHEIARLLLEHGASTPLMRASANGETKLVRLFLKHGADTSIRDAFGWNAERLAASAGHCKIFAAIQKHELRRSTSSYEALRWSQRSSGVFAALNLRLSTSMKDAKPRPEVSTPFPASMRFHRGSACESAATHRLRAFGRYGAAARSREKLANEAVKPDRQVQIVELDGLQLLLPLTKSKDTEVQRLAAHALANLSVNL